MSQTIPLPPPYQGQQDRIPVAAMEQPYCEICTNYNLDDGIATVRHGDTRLASIANSKLYGLAPYPKSDATELLFAAYRRSSDGNLVVKEITGGTPADYDSTIPAGDGATTSLYFNKYLTIFLRGTSQAITFNGSSWAWSGYTWPGSFAPYGGCIHKNRAYILGCYSSTYVYSGIDYISGAVTKRDMSGIISRGSWLCGMRSLSMREGIQQDNILIFLFSSGEVLAYSGAYPDSPDWSIIGRFTIPRPVCWHPFIDAAGDSYVITECGLISLRDLFQKGSNAAKDESIGAPITNRWDQIMTYLGGTTPLTSAISGVYDRARDRLIVCLPSYVDPVTEAVDTAKWSRLIYSFKTGAWFEHAGTAYEGVASSLSFASFVNGVPYYGISASNSNIMKMDDLSGTFQDAGSSAATNISYHLKTAPLPVPKTGTNKISGVEVIMKSDLYATTDFKLVGDLGVETTTAQKVTGNGTNLCKPLINAGINSTYVQLDISGTTAAGKTVGQEIYGLNIWVDQGGLR